MTDTLFGEDDRARKKMKISYQDHIRALTAAHSKMESSFKLLGLAFSAKNFQSGRRSETNVKIKSSYVNIPVEKRKAPEDVQQAAVLALAPPPKKSRKSAANPAPLPAESLEGKVREFVAMTPPANGTIYDLRELVQALCVQASSPIYQLSAKKVAPVLKLLGKLVCGVSTLERRCTSYRRDLILPSTGDDGAAVGRRPLISIHNIPDLNGNVLVNVGMTEGRDDLENCMNQIVAREREERGLPPQLSNTKYFSKHTRSKYDALASSLPGVARVKTSTTRTQGVRRQMARGSERNLYANIATVLDFNFIPGKWENKPDNLPEGARLAHSIIESAKGQEMHPCPAWQIFNYDFTPYYTWKGTSHRCADGDTWSRVSVESLDRGLRKHTSIKKDEGRNEDFFDSVSAGEIRVEAQSKKFKEPKMKWRKSKAKRILYNALLEGIIPVHDKNFQQMSLKDVYCIDPELALYDISLLLLQGNECGVSYRKSKHSSTRKSCGPTIGMMTYGSSQWMEPTVGSTNHNIQIGHRTENFTHTNTTRLA
ncbi:hypothetical protein IV203_015385 [Nitzschia inconspicua]|uniref:Uncharacterized protein n=1 Tax=Nitzschia inconspicua TaxID=303405 RepID=A0A9K3PTF5_9STRA|nr:hypothetical protein IV203_015385 [Nitzschia inconspicua]